jgi:single-stranded-DNA-specific exonuclease
VYGHKWPEGVVGLVAGKLKEKYNRPVLIGSLHNDIVKGSARSIPAFHIAGALKEVSDLLTQHGGHAQAAGFTLPKHNLESFSESILRLAEEKITEDDLIPELVIDMELPLELASTDLVDELFKMSPFGYGNTQPVFAFSKVRVSSKHIFGNGTKHVKLMLEMLGNLELLLFNHLKSGKRYVR